MESNTRFVLKVIVASMVISTLIKYVGPTLLIPATSAIALVMVFLPVLILSGVLSWRVWQQSQRG